MPQPRKPKPKAKPKARAAKKPAAVTPQVDRVRSTTPATAEPTPPLEETKREDVASDSPPVEAYQPTHPTLKNAGLDQVAAEKARQEELDAERQVHNERTTRGFKF